MVRYLALVLLVYAALVCAPDAAWAVPPGAGFNADPANGPAPLVVSFTDASTGNVTSWEWDFGEQEWQYRKAVTISNSGSALTDFQLRIDVAYVSGKMQNDFADLRFTAADGKTLLGYWIESCAQSFSARVWVKVPDIPAGSSTIYMYYGNSNAVSLSDGEATFVFFDSFDGTTLDPHGKWSITDPGGDITQDDALLIPNGPDTWTEMVQSVATFERAGQLTLEMDWTWTGGRNDPHAALMVGWHGVDAGVYYGDLVYAMYNNQQNGSAVDDIYEDGVKKGNVATWTKNLTYKVRLSVKPSGGCLYERSADGGDTWTTLYDSIYSTESPLSIGIANHSQEATIDNVRLRKYASSQPTALVTGAQEPVTHSFGSTGQNPTYTYSTPGTYTVKLTVSGPEGPNEKISVDCITVLELPPEAGFIADKEKGAVPVTINFTDLSEGNITSWSWDFGDGAGTGTEQNPAYTYTAAGTYTVTLTVTGPNGTDQKIRTNYITLGSTIYVDGTGGDDANDGSSWSNALRTMQTGINLALNGDAVLVADGSYTGASNRDLDFGGKLIHVRSAGGAQNCVIDCEDSGRGFYFHNNETREAVLEGFTITNGNTTGGGIYIYRCHPTIKNCIIRDCQSSGGGGGVYVNEYSDPHFINCLIVNNYTDSWWHIGGGGVWIRQTCKPTFDNCVIAYNSSAVYGGGIGIKWSSVATFNNCILWGNSAPTGSLCSNENCPVYLNNCDYTGSVYNGPVTPVSCISVDPQFVGTNSVGPGGYGDYHLQGTSPCVDAGSDSLVPAGVAVDLDGNPRILGEAVDIGAYEVLTMAPVVQITAPTGGSYCGNVQITYSLRDYDSDPADIIVHFSLDSGTSWSTCTLASGGDGTTQLASSLAGTSHVYVWDSVADGVGASAPEDVQLGIVPSDKDGTGMQDTTTFTVDNVPGQPPGAAITGPTGGSHSGDVAITYTLTDANGDPADIAAHYSIDSGTTWSTCTEGPGSDGVSALDTSMSGTSHIFVWASANDGVGIGAAQSVQVRITPGDDNGTGTPGSTTFTVSNPSMEPPGAGVVDPTGGIRGGNVQVTYNLRDNDSDPADIAVHYSLDSGASWATCTQGPGGDGTIALATSTSGTSHIYVWDSATDNVGTSAAQLVQLKITPSDKDGTGTQDTATFTVNNVPQEPPGVVITGPTGGTHSADIPITYILTDANADACSVTVEYSTDGGSTWGSCSEGLDGDGMSGLDSSVSGATHTFVWASANDGVGAGVDEPVQVRMTPSDNGGTGAQDTVSFTVNNVAQEPPGVVITSPLGGTHSGDVTITYILTDANSDTCSITVEYSTDGGTWYLCGQGPGGDGVGGLDSSTSGTTHTFIWASANDGVGTGVIEGVRIQVTPHEGGGSGLTAISGQFAVDNTGIIGPVANFTASSISGAAPLTVQFSDVSAGEYDSRSWDFDSDGVIDSNAANPTHTYRLVGIYSVTLTIDGPQGDDSITRIGHIAVTDPGTVRADFAASPASGDAPLSVRFGDLSVGDIESWSWDFGDGATSVQSNPVHQYTVAGTYTVTLMVSGPSGDDTETKAAYINVSPGPGGAADDRGGCRCTMNRAPTPLNNLLGRFTVLLLAACAYVLLRSRQLSRQQTVQHLN